MLRQADERSLESPGHTNPIYTIAHTEGEAIRLAKLVGGRRGSGRVELM